MTSSPPGVLECEGFELVGYCDLGGRPGFKLALHERDGRWLLYTGHLWESGWSVLDVTDPPGGDASRIKLAEDLGRLSGRYGREKAAAGLRIMRERYDLVGHAATDV